MPPRPHEPLQEPDRDRVLRWALVEESQRLPIPDPAESWRNLSRQLNFERRRVRRRRLAAISGAAVLALALLFTVVPPAARGWNPWTYARRFFVGSNSTGMVQFGAQQNVEGREPPPPDDVPGYTEVAPGVLVEPSPGGAPSARPAPSRPPKIGPTIESPPPETVSLAEAARRAPFPLRFPTWLPEGTKVLRVIYDARGPDGSFAEVQIHLGGSEGRDLHLTQMGPVEGFGSGTMFDRDNTRVREVEIDGVTSILLEFLHDGSSTLEWFAHGVVHRIRSDWDGDTTLRIARSLRADGLPRG